MVKLGKPSLMQNGGQGLPGCWVYIIVWLFIVPVTNSTGEWCDWLVDHLTGAKHMKSLAKKGSQLAYVEVWDLCFVLSGSLDHWMVGKQTFLATQKNTKQLWLEKSGVWKKKGFDTLVIYWIYPRPRMSVTTRTIPCLVGNPELSLHLWLLLGGG